jgi:hypothetical protein
VHCVTFAFLDDRWGERETAKEEEQKSVAACKTARSYVRWFAPVYRARKKREQVVRENNVRALGVKWINKAAQLALLCVGFYDIFGSTTTTACGIIVFVRRRKLKEGFKGFGGVARGDDRGFRCGPVAHSHVRYRTRSPEQALMLHSQKMIGDYFGSRSFFFSSHVIFAL